MDAVKGTARTHIPLPQTPPLTHTHILTHPHTSLTPAVRASVNVRTVDTSPPFWKIFRNVSRNQVCSIFLACEEPLTCLLSQCSTEYILDLLRSGCMLQVCSWCSPSPFPCFRPCCHPLNPPLLMQRHLHGQVRRLATPDAVTIRCMVFTTLPPMGYLLLSINPKEWAWSPQGMGVV